MNRLDEKYAAVFRDKLYTEIHLLTLDILDLLRLAIKRTLSGDELNAGIDACVKIRKVLDDANVDKLKNLMEHKQINESESE